MLSVFTFARRANLPIVYMPSFRNLTVLREQTGVTGKTLHGQRELRAIYVSGAGSASRESSRVC